MQMVSESWIFFVCGIVYKSWCEKPKRGEDVRGVTHHGHKIVALWVIIMVSNLLIKIHEYCFEV